ncbi:hypothetical protein M5D96_013997 [Drosophila gunungcola]|uniref:Uncharacterized protein n=1 Tax=Drosophila gunungcola TaxID=103775 RepID=A0A9P9YAU5_9MUSC|nr:hypothetical protein M5D96_013997 [Drosophila gunungcola]
MSGKAKRYTMKSGYSRRRQKSTNTYQNRVNSRFT